MPEPTLHEFLAALAKHPAPEDETLSAASLRLIVADLREHARRLLDHSLATVKLPLQND